MTENQETLQDIVSEVLNPKQDLEIYIDVEEKTFHELGVSKDAEEALFDVEDICRLSEELYIKDIRIFPAVLILHCFLVCYVPNRAFCAITPCNPAASVICSDRRGVKP
ncbi:MAG: hypothetical protein NC231_14310 [Bacillus sp. (in: Bacteria)]|nr:hypothetical protein [Bacillus sp. (in: firmicutes)]MCM1427703.1 hypothetical protein [Eubacterium sp.]